MRHRQIIESERINNNPDVSYDDMADKVIAKLKSYNSAVYTKLANRVEQITKLESEIKALKEEVKSIARQDVAGLFAAEDATKTRVIDTVSLIITLSKDPKPTVSYKYADILEELAKELTPQLIAVLDDIKDKYKTITQKEPSFKVQRKDPETLAESHSDKLRSYFSRYLKFIKAWGNDYDFKLNALKKKIKAS